MLIQEETRDCFEKKKEGCFSKKMPCFYPKLEEFLKNHRHLLVKKHPPLLMKTPGGVFLCKTRGCF